MASDSDTSQDSRRSHSITSTSIDTKRRTSGLFESIAALATSSKTESEKCIEIESESANEPEENICAIVKVESVENSSFNKLDKKGLFDLFNFNVKTESQSVEKDRRRVKEDRVNLDSSVEIIENHDIDRKGSLKDNDVVDLTGPTTSSHAINKRFNFQALLKNIKKDVIDTKIPESKAIGKEAAMVISDDELDEVDAAEKVNETVSEVDAVKTKACDDVAAEKMIDDHHNDMEDEDADGPEASGGLENVSSTMKSERVSLEDDVEIIENRDADSKSSLKDFVDLTVPTTSIEKRVGFQALLKNIKNEVIETAIPESESVREDFDNSVNESDVGRENDFEKDVTEPSKEDLSVYAEAKTKVPDDMAVDGTEKETDVGRPDLPDSAADGQNTLKEERASRCSSVEIIETNTDEPGSALKDQEVVDLTIPTTSTNVIKKRLDFQALLKNIKKEIIETKIPEPKSAKKDVGLVVAAENKEAAGKMTENRIESDIVMQELCLDDPSSPYWKEVKLSVSHEKLGSLGHLYGRSRKPCIRVARSDSSPVYTSRLLQKQYETVRQVVTSFKVHSDNRSIINAPEYLYTTHEIPKVVKDPERVKYYQRRRNSLFEKFRRTLTTIPPVPKRKHRKRKKIDKKCIPTSAEDPMLPKKGRRRKANLEQPLVEPMKRSKSPKQPTPSKPKPALGGPWAWQRPFEYYAEAVVYSIGSRRAEYPEGMCTYCIALRHVSAVYKDHQYASNHDTIRTRLFRACDKRCFCVRKSNSTCDPSAEKIQIDSEQKECKEAKEVEVREVTDFHMRASAQRLGDELSVSSDCEIVDIGLMLGKINRPPVVKWFANGKATTVELVDMENSESGHAAVICSLDSDGRKDTPFCCADVLQSICPVCFDHNRCQEILEKSELFEKVEMPEPVLNYSVDCADSSSPAYMEAAEDDDDEGNVCPSPEHSSVLNGSVAEDENKNDESTDSIDDPIKSIKRLVRKRTSENESVGILAVKDDGVELSKVSTTESDNPFFSSLGLCRRSSNLENLDWVDRIANRFDSETRINTVSSLDLKVLKNSEKESSDKYGYSVGKVWRRNGTYYAGNEALSESVSGKKRHCQTTPRRRQITSLIDKLRNRLVTHEEGQQCTDSEKSNEGNAEAIVTMEDTDRSGLSTASDQCASSQETLPDSVRPCSGTSQHSEPCSSVIESSVGECSSSQSGITVLSAEHSSPTQHPFSRRDSELSLVTSSVSQSSQGSQTEVEHSNCVEGTGVTSRGAKSESFAQGFSVSDGPDIRHSEELGKLPPEKPEQELSDELDRSPSEKPSHPENLLSEKPSDPEKTEEVLKEKSCEACPEESESILHEKHGFNSRHPEKIPREDSSRLCSEALARMQSDKSYEAKNLTMSKNSSAGSISPEKDSEAHSEEIGSTLLEKDSHQGSKLLDKIRSVNSTTACSKDPGPALLQEPRGMCLKHQELSLPVEASGAMLLPGATLESPSETPETFVEKPSKAHDGPEGMLAEERGEVPSEVGGKVMPKKPRETHLEETESSCQSDVSNEPFAQDRVKILPEAPAGLCSEDPNEMMSEKHEEVMSKQTGFLIPERAEEQCAEDPARVLQRKDDHPEHLENIGPEEGGELALATPERTLAGKNGECPEDSDNIVSKTLHDSIPERRKYCEPSTSNRIENTKDCLLSPTKPVILAGQTSSNSVSEGNKDNDHSMKDDNMRHSPVPRADDGSKDTTGDQLPKMTSTPRARNITCLIDRLRGRVKDEDLPMEDLSSNLDVSSDDEPNDGSKSESVDSATADIVDTSMVIDASSDDDHHNNMDDSDVDSMATDRSLQDDMPKPILSDLMVDDKDPHVDGKSDCQDRATTSEERRHGKGKNEPIDDSTEPKIAVKTMKSGGKLPSLQESSGSELPSETNETVKEDDKRELDIESRLKMMERLDSGIRSVLTTDGKFCRECLKLRQSRFNPETHKSLALIGSNLKVQAWGSNRSSHLVDCFSVELRSKSLCKACMPTVVVKRGASAIRYRLQRAARAEVSIEAGTEPTPKRYAPPSRKAGSQEDVEAPPQLSTSISVFSDFDFGPNDPVSKKIDQPAARTAAKASTKTSLLKPIAPLLPQIRIVTLSDKVVEDRGTPVVNGVQKHASRTTPNILRRPLKNAKGSKSTSVVETKNNPPPNIVVQALPALTREMLESAGIVLREGAKLTLMPVTQVGSVPAAGVANDQAKTGTKTGATSTVLYQQLPTPSKPAPEGLMQRFVPIRPTDPSSGQVSQVGVSTTVTKPCVAQPAGSREAVMKENNKRNTSSEKLVETSSGCHISKWTPDGKTVVSTPVGRIPGGADTASPTINFGRFGPDSSNTTHCADNKTKTIDPTINASKPSSWHVTQAKSDSVSDDRQDGAVSNDRAHPPTVPSPKSSAHLPKIPWNPEPPPKKSIEIEKQYKEDMMKIKRKVEEMKKIDKELDGGTHRRIRPSPRRKENPMSELFKGKYLDADGRVDWEKVRECVTDEEKSFWDSGRLRENEWLKEFCKEKITVKHAEQLWDEMMVKIGKEPCEGDTTKKLDRNEQDTPELSSSEDAKTSFRPSSSEKGILSNTVVLEPRKPCKKTLQPCVVTFLEHLDQVINDVVMGAGGDDSDNGSTDGLSTNSSSYIIKEEVLEENDNPARPSLFDTLHREVKNERKRKNLTVNEPSEDQTKYKKLRHIVSVARASESADQDSDNEWSQIIIPVVKIEPLDPDEQSSSGRATPPRIPTTIKKDPYENSFTRNVRRSPRIQALQPESNSLKNSAPADDIPVIKTEIDFPECEDNLDEMHLGQSPKSVETEETVSVSPKCEASSICDSPKSEEIREKAVSPSYEDVQDNSDATILESPTYAIQERIPEEIDPPKGEVVRDKPAIKLTIKKEWLKINEDEFDCEARRKRRKRHSSNRKHHKRKRSRRDREDYSPKTAVGDDSSVVTETVTDVPDTPSEIISTPQNTEESVLTPSQESLTTLPADDASVCVSAPSPATTVAASHHQESDIVPDSSEGHCPIPSPLPSINNWSNVNSPLSGIDHETDLDKALRTSPLFKTQTTELFSDDSSSEEESKIVVSRILESKNLDSDEERDVKPSVLTVDEPPPEDSNLGFDEGDNVSLEEASQLLQQVGLLSQVPF